MGVTPKGFRVGTAYKEVRRKDTYVHTRLSREIPYYQPMKAAVDMSTNDDIYMPGYEAEPAYAQMYPKATMYENQEVMEYGRVISLFIGVLLVGVFLKAIKTIGTVVQRSDPESNNCKVDQCKEQKHAGKRN